MFDSLKRKKSSSEYILSYGFYLGMFTGIVGTTLVFILDEYFKQDINASSIMYYIPWGYPYNTAVYTTGAAIFVFILATYYASRGLGMAEIEDLEGDLKL